MAKQPVTHDDILTKLRRVRALAFVLSAANDETSVDMSDYTADVADVIHEMTDEALTTLEQQQKRAKA